MNINGRIVATAKRLARKDGYEWWSLTHVQQLKYIGYAWREAAQ